MERKREREGMGWRNGAFKNDHISKTKGQLQQDNLNVLQSINFIDLIIPTIIY